MEAQATLPQEKGFPGLAEFGTFADSPSLSAWFKKKTFSSSSSAKHVYFGYLIVFQWRNSETRNSILVLLVVEVSKSRTIRHTHVHTNTHSVRLP